MNHSLIQLLTIKTLLTVIAEKFTNVIVSNPLTVNEKYADNNTHWRRYKAALVSGEAAAMINLESGRKRLSLLYYVDGIISDDEWETTISLVFEAAERANAIYQDTVHGLYVGDDTNSSSVTETSLKFLQLYKANASRLGLKLGCRVDWTDLLSPNEMDVDVKKTVEQSDFITFGMLPYNLRQGPLICFQSLTQTMASIRDGILTINPTLKVIAKTQWSSSELEEWATVENLGIYWEESNKWASENEYYIYHWEAFDNPWRAQSRPSLAYRGWWKLINESKFNQVDGYIEKISELGNGSWSATETGIDEPSSDGSWSTTETGEPSTDGSWSTTETGKPSTDGSWSTAETGTDEPSNNGDTLATELKAVGGILGVLVLLASIYSCYRAKTHTSPQCKEIQEFIYGNPNKCEATEGNCTLPTIVVNAPYDKSVEISKEKLKIDRQQVLGQGQFGCVFKATLELDDSVNIPVAVKTARHVRDPANLRGILYEIKILSYLGSHPNIVALKGAYTAELSSGVVYVALEMCTFGSLKKHLIEGNTMTVDATMPSCNESNTAGEQLQYVQLSTVVLIQKKELVRWAQEIASGMEYLEKKHIVHADLATRNVLLDSYKTAKISDFGLSRRMYNYTNYVEPLPWRWMAIESLRRLEFSSKSDVWSYGITLWELFSMGDVPYPDLSWSQDFIHRLGDGLRPECPLHASSGIYNVMRDCWNCEPRERPSFTELLESTKKWLQECSGTSTAAENSFSTP